MGEVQQELLPGKDELKQTVADIVNKHIPELDADTCGQLTFNARSEADLLNRLALVPFQSLARDLWKYRGEVMAMNGEQA